MYIAITVPAKLAMRPALYPLVASIVRDNVGISDPTLVDDAARAAQILFTECLLETRHPITVEVRWSDRLRVAARDTVGPDYARPRRLDPPHGEPLPLARLWVTDPRKTGPGHISKRPPAPKDAPIAPDLILVQNVGHIGALGTNAFDIVRGHGHRRTLYVEFEPPGWPTPSPTPSLFDGHNAPTYPRHPDCACARHT